MLNGTEQKKIILETYFKATIFQENRDLKLSFRPFEFTRQASIVNKPTHEFFQA